MKRLAGRGPIFWVVLVAGLLVAGTGAFLLSRSDDRSLLDCDGEVAEATGELGDGTITAPTPELLLQKTEYFEFLGIDPRSRVLVSDDPSPRFGLVEVAADADGVVTAAEDAGDATSFLAFVDGRRVARLYVERTPDGSGFWVSGASSC
jgi:hypothetical protein